MTVHVRRSCNTFLKIIINLKESFFFNIITLHYTHTYIIRTLTNDDHSGPLITNDDQRAQRAPRAQSESEGPGPNQNRAL